MKHFNWSEWLYGLWVAVIGGGATSAQGVLATIIIDPKDFNPQTVKFYQMAGIMFGVGAVTSFLAFLKQHPAPTPAKPGSYNSISNGS